MRFDLTWSLVASVLLILLVLLTWRLWRGAKGASAAPKPPRQKRDPKPFAGLTHKPECALCEQGVEGDPPMPGAPPPRMIFTRGRRRQVEAAEHLEAFSRYHLHDLYVEQVQMDELFALLSAVKDGEVSERQAITRLSLLQSHLSPVVEAHCLHVALASPVNRSKYGTCAIRVILHTLSTTCPIPSPPTPPFTSYTSSHPHASPRYVDDRWSSAVSYDMPKVTKDVLQLPQQPVMGECKPTFHRFSTESVAACLHRDAA